MTVPLVTNRRLVVRGVDVSLSADVPDGVSLEDAEVELSLQLARVMNQRRRRDAVLDKLQQSANQSVAKEAVRTFGDSVALSQRAMQRDLNRIAQARFDVLNNDAKLAALVESTRLEFERLKREGDVEDAAKYLLGSFQPAKP